MRAKSYNELSNSIVKNCFVSPKIRGKLSSQEIIKGQNAIDIDEYLSSPPHLLLAKREVKKPYAALLGGSLSAMKISKSLGYQMRASIQDLMSELKEQGKDYDLLLEGGFYGDSDRRWNLYLNGERFAIIDDDYGYDCFDESAALFKTKIAELIEDAERRSTICPLSRAERERLNKKIDSEPLKWGRSTSS